MMASQVVPTPGRVTTAETLRRSAAMFASEWNDPGTRESYFALTISATLFLRRVDFRKEFHLHIDVLFLQGFRNAM